jgi:hypothetical protein
MVFSHNLSRSIAQHRGPLSDHGTLVFANVHRASLVFCYSPFLFKTGHSI